MKSFIAIIVVWLSAELTVAFQPVAAKEPQFAGLVVGITDGDTIKVLHDGAPEKIRLEGIDCPEKRQPFGSTAKTFTSEMCFGKFVTVVPKTRDRYGRTVGEVLLPAGRDLNQELVAHGYAWWYQKYSPTDKELQQLEIAARKNHTGLWADPNPVPPWEFRNQKKLFHPSF